MKISHDNIYAITTLACPCVSSVDDETNQRPCFFVCHVSAEDYHDERAGDGQTPAQRYVRDSTFPAKHRRCSDCSCHMSVTQWFALHGLAQRILGERQALTGMRRDVNIKRHFGPPD
jgi:hypothetical protein